MRGFEVIVRSNRHPSLKMGSIVVYRPETHSEEQMERISEAVFSAGLEIDGTFPLQLGAHSYSSGNIGLYPLGAGFHLSEDSSTEPLINIELTDRGLKSTGCDSSYVLSFRENGELLLKEISEGETEWQRLQWSRGEGGLVRVFDEENRYDYRTVKYQKEESQSSGTRMHYYLELEPEGFYPMPYACTYRIKQTALLGTGF